MAESVDLLKEATFHHREHREHRVLEAVFPALPVVHMFQVITEEHLTT
jgi:hypothetical protein